MNIILMIGTAITMMILAFARIFSVEVPLIALSIVSFTACYFVIRDLILFGKKVRVMALIKRGRLTTVKNVHSKYIWFFNILYVFILMLMIITNLLFEGYFQMFSTNEINDFLTFFSLSLVFMQVTFRSIIYKLINRNDELKELTDVELNFLFHRINNVSTAEIAKIFDVSETRIKHIENQVIAKGYLTF